MEEFVRNRITQLRLSKGLSEYQLSYDLGHSRSYINNISSGKSLPSLGEFFQICDYFDITPSEFFDSENNHPVLIKNLCQELKGLSEDDLLLVLAFIKRINGKL